MKKLRVAFVPAAPAAAPDEAELVERARRGDEEAFLRGFRALAGYRHQTSFAAWMRVIALRAAIDLVRRRRPEFPIAENTGANGTGAGAGSEEKRHLDADLLREALASLSTLDRELLLAREVEGEADREIALRFDMTVTGVRVRIHRARKKLRERFAGRSR